MTTANYDPDGERIDLGDGTAIPAEITATSEDVGGYAVDLTAVYEPARGRYAAREVKVRAGTAQEVTSEGLHVIPVAGIVRHAVASVVAPMLEPRPTSDPAVPGKSGPTTDTLQNVARIYRLALLLGDAPTQRVAEALDIPRSTAGRWVTRARDRGYLTVVDPRAPRPEA